MGAGAASRTGAPPTVTLTASRFGPAFGVTTSTLGDAPSISTCAGPAPARLFTLDVPVASHLRGRATSFGGAVQFPAAGSDGTMGGLGCVLVSD